MSYSQAEQSVYRSFDDSSATYRANAGHRHQRQRQEGTHDEAQEIRSRPGNKHALYPGGLERGLQARGWCLGGVRRKSSGGAGDPQPAFVMAPVTWINVSSYVRGRRSDKVSKKVRVGTKYARIDEGELLRVIVELASRSVKAATQIKCGRSGKSVLTHRRFAVSMYLSSYIAVMV